MWRSSAIPLTLALLGASVRTAGAPLVEPGGWLPTPPDLMQGRWDITIRTPDGDRPSWVEIRRSGHEALVGQFVGVVGSARPVARVDVSGDSLRFSIPRQWEDGTGDLVVEGRLQGEQMSGRMTFPDGK